MTKGFSPATGDLDGYRRLGEIPQNNENALSGCPSRIGDQFCSAAFAQDKEEVNPFPFRAIAASPQLVQQLDAIKLKLDEAFNKLDAAAVAALYIANAVQVTPVGIFSGREAIEKFYTDVFQRYTPSDHVRKISYVYAFGADLCAIGGWTDIVHGSRPTGGYFLDVFTHPGDTWKIRAEVLKYEAGR